MLKRGWQDSSMFAGGVEAAKLLSLDESVDNGKQCLISDLRFALAKDRFWRRSLSVENEKRFTLHLADFREAYLTSIMEGKKTIETRFAKRPCAPYQRISGRGHHRFEASFRWNCRYLHGQTRLVLSSRR